MHKLVKESFSLIIMVTIAMILYFILFGSWNSSGMLTDATFQYESGNAAISTVENGTVTQARRWQGVLWYIARTVENPIAYYYYNYCLIPNVHGNDYLDMELGCKVYNQTSQNGITMADYLGQTRSMRYSGRGSGSYVTYPTEFSSGPDSYAFANFVDNHYSYSDINNDDF